MLAVKQHPDGKILRDILEAMRDMRSAEQHVARTNSGYRVLDSITAGSRGDEIEFVALMRDLRSIAGSGDEPDLKITVKNTSDDRPSVRGRASAAASDTGGGVRSMGRSPDKENNDYRPYANFKRGHYPGRENLHRRFRTVLSCFA